MTKSKVAFFPWSKPLRNGKQNAKNYHRWPEVVSMLESDESIELVQFVYGSEQRLVRNCIVYESVRTVEQLLPTFHLWLSVDNFVQHLVHAVGGPVGVVVWSKSDPTIFGYDSNVNLLKGREYLRANQFLMWDDEPFDERAFIEPKLVYDSVKKMIDA